MKNSTIESKIYFLANTLLEGRETIQKLPLGIRAINMKKLESRYMEINSVFWIKITSFPEPESPAMQKHF